MSLKEKYNPNLETVSSHTSPPVSEEPKKKFRWRVVDDHSPKEIYNFTLYFTVFIFGILGAARGYDEGCISGATHQDSFKRLFGLDDKSKSPNEIANLKSNITSMVQLGSVGGAILAMYTVDKLGRVRALQEVCLIWIAGAIIQITSKNVGQLYAGRLIEGFAIGQTTTIGPTFMSEVSPPAYRGLFGCLFSGSVYLGIFTSYAANYGSAKHISGTSNTQWIIPTSMKIVLAGLVFIGSFFCVESPRWLIKVRKSDKALHNLCRLRKLPPDHPYIMSEISDINEAVLAEKLANENYSMLHKFKDIVMIKSVRYRFFAIGVMSQVLGQWSGANAITIYANDLFSFIGIKGIETLKMSVILGLVRFVGAYFSAFFVIDFLGRRKALYIGISIQMVMLLYFAIFLTVVPQAVHEHVTLTGSQKAASKGAMAALILTGIGWTMGFNSVQYLLGSEIFPLGLRSFGQSLIMVLHFANQFGNSKAVPKMLLALHPFGAFYFFTAVCACSLFWAWFFIPEISGRSLESMEEIFNLPWYLVGRRGPKLCPDTSEVNKINYNLRNSGEHGSIVYNDESLAVDRKKVSEEFVENASVDSKDKK